MYRAGVAPVERGDPGQVRGAAVPVDVIPARIDDPAVVGHAGMPFVGLVKAEAANVAADASGAAGGSPAGRLQTFGQPGDVAVKSFDQLTKEAAAMERATQRATAEIAALADQIRSDVATPLDRHKERIEGINRAFKAGAISWEVFNAALKKSRSTLDNLSTKTKKAADNMQSPGASMRESAQSARAIDLSLVSIRGLALMGKRKQQVEDKQANDLLRKIEQNTSNGNVAVAG